MTNPLEIAANVLMTASIILAGRNNIHSWWIGMLGCVLFAVLFYEVNLYADVLLQLFFIVTCVIGWLQWRRGARRPSPWPEPLDSKRIYNQFLIRSELKDAAI